MKSATKRLLTSILAALFLAPALLFAAGTKENSGAAGEEPATGAETAAESGTVTVVDSLGNEVVIPSHVTRVAALRSGIIEIICALGKADLIVAVDEMTKAGTMYGQFAATIHPELMNQVAPYAGRDVNIEALLATEPDLLLHGGYGRIRQADAIRAMAPQLPVVIAHFETLDAYMDDIRIVGKCVNAEAEAEKLIAFLEKYLNDLEKLTAKIPADARKKVYYTGHDVYHAYGGDTFEHYQIVRAGGINVAEGLTGWMPEVSAEQLLLWNPDVIVMLNGADVNAVLSDEKLRDLAAVKNRAVYALPEAGWDFSTPRALFCMEWIFSLLYPERYGKTDIETRADQYFQAVFKADYTGPSLKGK